MAGVYDRSSMRFFHVADLHLGKSLHERDLLDDQRHALDAIRAAAALEKPACVLIAGDVFDRAVPPAEALSLFGDFVAWLRAGPGRPVVVAIPGNHDSAGRLSYMAPVLAESGVRLAAEPDECDRPIVVERDGERARVWAVPFLNPGAFARPAGDPAPDAVVPQGELFAERDAEPLRSQAALFAEAARRIASAIGKARRADGAAADVAVCHAFARGGTSSESERVFLGDSELVELGPLELCDYIALGHLHRPQPAGAKGFYPGSIMAYSFAEASYDHGFVSVDIRKGSAARESRSITPLRRLTRIRGAYDALLSDEAFSRFEGDYVEATLDDASEILDPMAGLKRRFPFALSIRRPETSAETRPSTYGRAAAGGSVLDDFAAFYRELRGEDPSEADVALFEELFREANGAAP